MIVGLDPQTIGQVLNVGSGKPTRLVDLAQMIIRIVGRGQVKHAPWPRQSKMVETGDFYADISRICRITGWIPHTQLEDGLCQFRNFQEGTKS
jgi:nucleoside-diphosphate-sugar epimerase